MSEALGVDAREAAADATPGAVLRRERERRALSVQQTAEDLHLDPWIIEAIESNRFHALGAPVYAKGHLRKYAARLGLSAEDLIARYEGLQDRPVTADPIPTAVAAPVRPPRRSWARPIGVTILIAAAAGLGWLAVEYLTSEDGPLVLQSPVDVVPASMPQESEQAVTPPASPGVSQSSSEEQDDVPAALPLAAPVQTTSDPSGPAVPSQLDTRAEMPATNESVELRLAFSGESWTEVYDAEGRRLMFAMGTPGRVRTLSGVPPFQVTLGAASAVTAQLNGRAVSIPQRNGRDSARFTLGADGSLR